MLVELRRMQPEFSTASCRHKDGSLAALYAGWISFKLPLVALLCKGPPCKVHRRFLCDILTLQLASPRGGARAHFWDYARYQPMYVH